MDFIKTAVRWRHGTLFCVLSVGIQGYSPLRLPRTALRRRPPLDLLHISVPGPAEVEDLITPYD